MKLATRHSVILANEMVEIYFFETRLAVKWKLRLFCTVSFICGALTIVTLRKFDLTFDTVNII